MPSFKHLAFAFLLTFVMANEDGPQKTSTRLYVASYGGYIASLNYLGRDFNSTPIVSHNADCGPSPSWLLWDADRRVVHCLNEGIGQPSGSLVTYSADMNGSLAKLGKTITLPGPVHGSFLDANKTGLVVAHYDPGAVSVIDLKDIKSPRVASIKNLPSETARTVPNRQETSHAHETIIDPLGKYVLIPDLGADQVRVLSVSVPATTNSSTAAIKEYDPLDVPPGTGPRHAVFWAPSSLAKYKQGEPLFFVVLGELSSEVLTYRATYIEDAPGMNFALINTTSTVGIQSAPSLDQPAEISVSPDNNFITLSNRYDRLVNLPIVPGLQGGQPGDSLATFSIGYNNKLDFLEFEFKKRSTAGGSGPRHFAFNNRGDAVAVGLVDSNLVVVMSRDISTGEIGKVLSVVQVSRPTNIVWDEA